MQPIQTVARPLPSSLAETREHAPHLASAAWRPRLLAMLSTDSSKTRLLQRVVLAGVLLPHGLQKTFGWFGGGGFDGTIAWFQTALGVPSPITALVIASESIGALALALGLFSRLTALGVTLTMLGAIALVHAPHGFFMNWFGENAGEGYEFHLLALALSIPLIIRGGGAASLDTWLTRRVNAIRPNARP